jgi:phosphoserine phosphatase
LSLYSQDYKEIFSMVSMIKDFVFVMVAGQSNNNIDQQQSIFSPSFYEDVATRLNQVGITLSSWTVLCEGKAVEAFISLESREGTSSQNEGGHLEGGDLLSILREKTESLRSFLSSFFIDMGVVSAQNRQKKLILADMDSTIITIECIDELADYAGVKPEVSAITAKAMRGELNFEESLAQRVALLRGLPVTVLNQCYKERVRFMAGAELFIKTMAEKGAYCALVSGGFTFFTEKAASALGFHEHRANTLLSENGVLTGGVGMPILGKNAKKEALEALCQQLNITPQDVLAVGDGANDLAMIDAAGLGVAAHAKPAVAAAADVQINFAGLEALLYLQGYKISEEMIF